MKCFEDTNYYFVCTLIV